MVAEVAQRNRADQGEQRDATGDQSGSPRSQPAQPAAQPATGHREHEQFEPRRRPAEPVTVDEVEGFGEQNFHAAAGFAAPAAGVRGFEFVRLGVGG